MSEIIHAADTQVHKQSRGKMAKVRPLKEVVHHEAAWRRRRVNNADHRKQRNRSTDEHKSFPWMTMNYSAV